MVGNEATLRNERRGWGPWIEWAYAMGCVAGREQKGTYDQAKVRALATGKKDFLEAQKQRQAQEYGVAAVRLAPVLATTDPRQAAHQSAERDEVRRAKIARMGDSSGAGRPSVSSSDRGAMSAPSRTESELRARAAAAAGYTPAGGSSSGGQWGGAAPGSRSMATAGYPNHQGGGEAASASGPRHPAMLQAAGPARPPLMPPAKPVSTSMFTTPGDPSTNTPAMNKGDVLKVMETFATGWIDVVTPLGARGYVWKDWIHTAPALR